MLFAYETADGRREHGAFVSDDVHREYTYRRARVDELRRAGAHRADVEYQREEILVWLRRLHAAGLGSGNRLIGVI